MSELIFRKITSTKPIARYITDVIARQLTARQRVLWLVPGGSSMAVAVEASKLLRGYPLENLRLTLTDERYCKISHKNSNWHQLINAGLKLSSATMRPVLKGKSLEQTTQDYSLTLVQDLKWADYSLALAGIGSDGHIFGIKPGSPAVESNEPVIGYKWDDYTRITPTVNILSKFDEVVIYATGKPKWPQLDTLEQKLDPNMQPAQLLKRLKKVIIFNDHKGESV